MIKILRPIFWSRVVIVVATSLPFLFSLADAVLGRTIGQGETPGMFLFLRLLGVILLGVILLELPSALVAYGLYHGERWAAWLAVIYDVVAVPGIAVFILPGAGWRAFRFDADNTVFLLFGLYSLVELIYLIVALTAYKRRRQPGEIAHSIRG